MVGEEVWWREWCGGWRGLLNFVHHSLCAEKSRRKLCGHTYLLMVKFMTH